MTLAERDKRALMALGAAGAVALIVYFWPQAGPGVVVPAGTPATAEKRLAQMRGLVTQVPAKEVLLNKVSADLTAREKGMVVADTAAQAQAQLLQILRRLARNQAPPLDFKSTELGQPAAFGDDYGVVAVALSFDCRIEQLLNFLSDVSAQPELLASHDLRINAASAKEKLMPVRLTVSAVVPRKLIPQKKGLGF
jgi:hypothetical protein